MADPFVVRALKRVLSPSFRGKLRFQLWTRLPTRAAILYCRLFRRRGIVSPHSNILLVRLDGMGDCVMTIPLLQELRRCNPSATISIVVQQSWAPLMEAVASVDHVLPLRPLSPRFLPKSAWQFYSCMGLYLRSLRGRKYDLVINPRWDADFYLATMLCALTLAPVRAGYEDSTSFIKREENIGFQDAYNIVIEAGPLRHEVLRNLEVLRALGHEPHEIAPSLSVSDEQTRWADAWLGDKPHEALLVLGLPASAAKKRWDHARYIELIGLIKTDRDVAVVLIADAATLSVAKTIANACPGTRIAFNLPLQQAAALVERCDVYVGCDSGFAHVSAALKRTSIVLFPHPHGANAEHASSPTRFQPFGEDVVVIRPKARPGCEQYCASSEPHCILDIDPHEVATLIEERLNRRNVLSNTVQGALNRRPEWIAGTSDEITVLQTAAPDHRSLRHIEALASPE